MKLSRMTCQSLFCATSCLAAALLSPALSADPLPSLSSQNPGSPDYAPGYDKVVLVIEENQQYSTIIGNSAAPYTNLLADQGALMTQSYGTEHPSQPNYLDLFSGGDQNVYDDNFPNVVNLPFSGENLAAQLLHQGQSFAGYSEDLPYVGDTVDNFGSSPGDPAGTHDYARKHNPWANWQNDAFAATKSNYGSNYLPSSVNQPLTPFTNITATGAFENLPKLSVVVPNQKHDDHGISGGASGNQLIADGDTWLKNNIGPYADWAKTHHSLLIITWDEDDYSSINRVPTIFYGDQIKTGRYSEPRSVSFTSVINADNQPSGAPEYEKITGINHWNVLRTMENIFRLGHIGQANKVASITDIFETK